jgi:hypothetical protein
MGIDCRLNAVHPVLPHGVASAWKPSWLQREQAEIFLIIPLKGVFLI